jgi:peroxiredoxin Q/BCP
MEIHTVLEPGDKAPSFSLPDETGRVRTLSEYKGKWVVLYFYPKDDTPGCTKEACAIRDVFEDFSRMGVTVLGVSKDSPESHTAFKEKYGLPFTLLSDEAGSMIEAYGAWQEKTMFGKTGMGIARITYIINPEQSIEKVYEEVDPANHALQLLAELESILEK